MYSDAKLRVKNFWEKQVCDTRNGRGVEGTQEYYESIESARIASLEFAKPTHYTSKKVLEVGVGSGVDFVQWCKAGCNACGIDLTEAGIAHAKKWLQFLHLEPYMKDLQVADAENLPFDNNTFDLVYSWGVLHHSPDTQRAINECIRVCKKGGEIKLMLYNKLSIMVPFLWLHTMRRDKTFHRLDYGLTNGTESWGTKAFTPNEIRELVWGTKVIELSSRTNKYDTYFAQMKIIQYVAAVFNFLTNQKAGWFTTVRLIK